MEKINVSLPVLWIQYQWDFHQKPSSDNNNYNAIQHYNVHDSIAH